MVAFNRAGLIGVLLSIAPWVVLGSLANMGIGSEAIAKLFQGPSELVELICLSAFIQACFGCCYDRVPKGEGISAYLLWYWRGPDDEGQRRIAFFGGPLVDFPLLLLAVGILAVFLGGDDEGVIAPYVIWPSLAAGGTIVVWLCTLPLRSIAENATPDVADPGGTNQSGHAN